MLFIIKHQTSELWMKLMIHELTAAIQHLRKDDLSPCFKILSRVKQIQMQLFNQWAVLETLTPTEYLQFRSVLGNSSGFQSAQYREVEFLLGNKNADMVQVHAHDGEARAVLGELLPEPSLYDEFLAHLARQGYAVPQRLLERDFSLPHTSDPDLVDVFAGVYAAPSEHWGVYETCEELVDVEDAFQQWRFRHLQVVQRVIGHKIGTGGSSGVHFLQKALELTFFPELRDVRTHL
jgi:tryptophan 2,3-dioxygenase